MLTPSCHSAGARNATLRAMIGDVTPASRERILRWSPLPADKLPFSPLICCGQRLHVLLLLPLVSSADSQDSLAAREGAVRAQLGSSVGSGRPPQRAACRPSYRAVPPGLAIPACMDPPVSRAPGATTPARGDPRRSAGTGEAGTSEAGGSEVSWGKRS